MGSLVDQAQLDTMIDPPVVKIYTHLIADDSWLLIELHNGRAKCTPCTKEDVIMIDHSDIKTYFWQPRSRLVDSYRYDANGRTINPKDAVAAIVSEINNTFIIIYKSNTRVYSDIHPAHRDDDDGLISLDDRIKKLESLLGIGFSIFYIKDSYTHPVVFEDIQQQATSTINLAVRPVCVPTQAVLPTYPFSTAPTVQHDDSHTDISTISPKKRAHDDQRDKDVLLDSPTKRIKTTLVLNNHGVNDTHLLDQLITVGVKHAVDICPGLLRPDINRIPDLCAVVSKLLYTAKAFSKHHHVGYPYALCNLLHKKMSILFTSAGNNAKERYLHMQDLDKDDALWLNVMRAFKNKHTEFRCSEKSLYQSAGCLAAIVDELVESHKTNQMEKLNNTMTTLKNPSSEACINYKLRIKFKYTDYTFVTKSDGKTKISNGRTHKNQSFVTPLEGIKAFLQQLKTFLQLRPNDDTATIYHEALGKYSYLEWKAVPNIPHWYCMWASLVQIWCDKTYVKYVSALKTMQIEPGLLLGYMNAQFEDSHKTRRFSLECVDSVETARGATII